MSEENKADEQKEITIKAADGQEIRLSADEAAKWASQGFNDEAKRKQLDEMISAQRRLQGQYEQFQAFKDWGRQNPEAFRMVDDLYQGRRKPGDFEAPEPGVNGNDPNEFQTNTNTDPVAGIQGELKTQLDRLQRQNEEILAWRDRQQFETQRTQAMAADDLLQRSEKGRQIAEALFDSQVAQGIDPAVATKKVSEMLRSFKEEDLQAEADRRMENQQLRTVPAGQGIPIIDTQEYQLGDEDDAKLRNRRNPLSAPGKPVLQQAKKWLTAQMKQAQVGQG